MSNACPLNFKQVDSNVSRFSALLVALLVVAYLVTQNVFILYFLALDFVMRLFVKDGFSAISLLSKLLKNAFKMQESLVDGGAKRLAGFLGLFFVLLLIVIHYFSAAQVTYILGAVFLTCSLLDVFFDFCIGCKIYFIIKKIYPNFMNKL